MEHASKELDLEAKRFEDRQTKDCARQAEQVERDCKRQYEQHQQWNQGQEWNQEQDWEKQEWNDQGNYPPYEGDQGQYNQPYQGGEPDDYYPPQEPTNGSYDESQSQEDGSSDGENEQPSDEQSGDSSDTSSGGDEGESGDGSGGDSPITGAVTNYPGFGDDSFDGGFPSGPGPQGYNSGPQGPPGFGPGGFPGGPGFGPGGPGFGGPGGPNNGVDAWEFCDEETGTFKVDSFTKACINNGNENFDLDNMKERVSTMCDVQAGFMLEEFENICYQMEEGLNECKDNAARILSFAEKQLDRCQQQTTTENIRVHVQKKVNEVCIIDRLKQKRIQNVKLRDLKAIEALEGLENINFGDDETEYAVKGIVTGKVVAAAEASVETQERHEKDRGDFLGYGLPAFFGLKSEDAKTKAATLREQAAELRASAQLLRESASNADDETSEAIHSQADKLEEDADSNEEEAEEIVSSGGFLGGSAE